MCRYKKTMPEDMSSLTSPSSPPENLIKGGDSSCGNTTPHDQRLNAQLLQQKGVHLIGDFQGTTGLCQSGRDLIAAIEHIGCPYEVLDMPMAPGRFVSNELTWAEAEGLAPPKSPISIITWNSDSYEMMARMLPAHVFQNRRMIGVNYWETGQGLPEGHARGLDYVDEVWVATDYIGKSISASTSLPINKYPYFFKPATVPNPLVLPPELQHDRFVFLFSFDARSVLRRKNPSAVCEAFVTAFPERLPGGPVCVIKSIAAEETYPIEYLETRSRFWHRPDIIFMDRYLPVAERDSLLSRADCYVSLHHSEGLGLTLMESMALGKPCIATGYSGNLEFMTPDNSWLIPYNMVEIGPGICPYPPEHKWAAPDVFAAAKAMREVYQNPELAAKKAALGRETILNNHSLEVVSQQVRKLLLEAYAKPLPKRKTSLDVPSSIQSEKETLLPQQSSRAMAYHLMREVRELEDQLKIQKKLFTKTSLTPEAREYIETLQKIIKSQRQIQSHTLREIGDLKLAMNAFNSAIYGRVTSDRESMAKILKQLLEQQPRPS